MASVSGCMGKRQWLVSTHGFVNLQVVAKTESSSRRILGRDQRGLVIALNSQPSKGRANGELIAFLAELLGTSRSSVTIIRGHAARVKTLRIVNAQSARVAELLRAYS